jgi:hypothetical protein
LLKSTCSQGHLDRPWDESELKDEPDVTLKGSSVPTLCDIWHSDGNRQTGILGLAISFLQFDKAASEGSAQQSSYRVRC